MKKSCLVKIALLFAATLAIFIVGILLIVDDTANVAYSSKKDQYDIGIAEKLVDNVNVLAIYVEDGSDLSPEMKQRFNDELIKAERWLLDEAERQRIFLSFDNHNIGWKNSIEYHPTKSWMNVEPRDVIISAFNGQDNANLWFERHPNCAVILFIGNRSWDLFCTAISMKGFNNNRYPYLEGAKIYPYEMYEKSLEIAHEMLHLFGANDLYDGTVAYREEYACTESEWNNYRAGLRQSVINGRKYKSIMYETWGNINRHYVDELNAYLIGWTDQKKDWYDFFQQ